MVNSIIACASDTVLIFLHPSSQCRKGVSAVFVSTPSTPDFDKHFKSFVTASKKAHVHRVIKLSWYHALRSRAEDPTKYFGDPDYLLSKDNFHDIPLVHQHALCDGDLIVGGVDCTILFASHLMSNVIEYQSTTLKEDGKFYGASGGKGVNYVSPNDVADIAVRCILDPKTHRRQGYVYCAFHLSRQLLYTLSIY